MIRLIIRKEFREFFRASKLVWVFAGVFALMLLALYNGYAYYTGHLKLTAQAQAISYDQFINQGDKNPHTGAHFGFYAFRPTPTLALIESGLDDFAGTTFYLEPHKRGEVKFKESADSTGLRRFGFLSIGYFTQFIFPLFIFLICHDIFAKEWENGTIKILLSTRATTRQIYLGKLLTCLAVVFSIIAVIVVSSLLILWLESPPDAFRRVLPSFLQYVLFLVVFSTLVTLIGVAVSLLAKNASFALIVLGSFWLVGVFLLPRLSGEVSKQLYPSVTAVAFRDQTYQLTQYGTPGQGHRDLRRQKLLRQILDKYKVSRPEDLPVNFIPIAIEHFEDSDADVMNAAYADIDRNFERQNAFVQWCSVLSPFAAFRDISMALSATDFRSHLDFTQKAEDHRIRVQTIVADFYEENGTADKRFWQTIPQFSYTPFDAGQRLANAGPAILTLLAWLAIAVALTLYSLKKMNV